MNPSAVVEGLSALLTPEERRAFLDAHVPRADAQALIDDVRASVNRYARDDPARARQLAALAWEIAEWAGDAPLCRASAAWAEANAHYYQGDFARCLDLYRQAWEAYEAHGDALAAARLRGNGVAVLNHLGRYAEAAALSEVAHPVLARYGVTPYLGLLELNRSMLYRHLDRYAEALDACARGQEVATALNNPVLGACLDVNRALVLADLGRLDEAITVLESTHPAFTAAGERLEAARSLLNIGLIRLHTGHYAEALRVLDRSREEFAALQNEMEVATVDWHKAQAYLHLNLLPEVIALCQAARSAYEARGMARYVAEVDVVAARAYARLGEHDRATQSLSAAVPYFTGVGAEVTAARLTMEQSDVLLLAGRAAEALSLAQQSVTTLEARGLSVSAARARLSLADALAATGQEAAAQEAYESALAAIGGTGPVEWRYRAYVGLGRLAEHAGRLTDALAHYRQAIEEAVQAAAQLGEDESRLGFLHDKLEACQAAVLISLQMGDAEGAFALIERVKSVGVMARLDTQSLRREPLMPDEIIRRLQEELAQLREAWRWRYSQLQGRPEDEPHPETSERSAAAEVTAWKELRACERRLAEVVRTLRRQLPPAVSPARPTAVHPESLPVYVIPSESLARRPGQAASEESRHTQQEMPRSADSAPWPDRQPVLPALDGRPGWPGTGDRQHDVLRGAARDMGYSLRAVQQSLGEGTSLLVYYVARGRVIALAVGPAGHAACVLETPWEEIERELDRLRFALRRVSPHARYHLARLYDWLVRPLEPLLAGSDGLVVVPHDRLFYLPFHALYAGDHYLAERMAVRYLPSAISHQPSAISHQPSSVVGRPSSSSGHALVMGYSDEGRLPATRQEAQLVHDLLAARRGSDSGGLAAVTLCLEEQATSSAFWQHTTSCDVIHLATHGVFRQDNPLFSALRLADGWLLLGDLDRLILPPGALVALSGCETGLGGLRGGELLGLSRAFLEAGAGALLVSLWEVPDVATARLMTAFYTAFTAGQPAGQALRTAQRALIGTEEFNHPYYWAGPCLVGGE